MPGLSRTLSPGAGKWLGTVPARKLIFHIGDVMDVLDGPIAQLDRVTDFYSVGYRFESCWDRQCFQGDGGISSFNQRRATKRIPGSDETISLTPRKHPEINGG